MILGVERPSIVLEQLDLIFIIIILFSFFPPLLFYAGHFYFTTYLFDIWYGLSVICEGFPVDTFLSNTFSLRSYLPKT